MIENASYYNEIRTCFISSNSNISSVALVEVANIQDLKALFRSREMTSYRIRKQFSGNVSIGN